MKSAREQQRVEQLVAEGFDERGAREVVSQRSGYPRGLTKAAGRRRRRAREEGYARQRRAKEGSDRGE
jgi:hypothetical protein